MAIWTQRNQEVGINLSNVNWLLKGEKSITFHFYQGGKKTVAFKSKRLRDHHLQNMRALSMRHDLKGE